MSLRNEVEKVKSISTGTPLKNRLTPAQQRELDELADMYVAGELTSTSWKALTEMLRNRWGQKRLQVETLKRNLVRLADERTQSGQRSGAKKVSRG